ncbi:sulfotransferase family 2 domain-containing protein [Nocardioides bruguierae]|uniref:sulfotransferase family 2 domain-containing protein n=1 Tax=Nocardioides bruguierae TaxID=2945102 RepID=UPI0020224FAE|nr:sulfotransferase family 2 domain-containing protein [Nocardioides bruguierae]MCL8024332.1 sulfotransferase family 2 domain-containing protein [Nocardioides bruguierae]
MIISDRARLLFVHVQQTGGAVVAGRLRELLPDARRLPGVDRHAPLGQLLRAEPGLTGHWTFGVVRNPWARTWSWWRHVERVRNGTASAEGGERRQQFLAEVGETCEDFEAFVMRGLGEYQRLQTPQVRYLTTRGRRADLIGRQESLEADLRAVVARLDLPWTPLTDGPDLAGDPEAYREAYSEPMRRRVEAVFARDVAAFGYEF